VTAHADGVDTVAWLLESDPAIRWQAMRDLTAASPAAIAAERARVSREGLGVKILARQELDGSWRRSDAPVWLSTLFTFLLLRATGVDRAEPAVEAAVTRLEARLGWDNQAGFWELRLIQPGVRPFFEGEIEPCINGGTLALGGYFGRPTESLARRLINEQLDFREADIKPDARVSDAVHLIKSKRQADGRWLLERAYDETLPVPFGESVSEPSRWNTLRALRVLRWYEPREPQATSSV
jgi:hypothetical protein